MVSILTEYRGIYRWHIDALVVMLCRKPSLIESVPVLVVVKTTCTLKIWEPDNCYTPVRKLVWIGDAWIILALSCVSPVSVALHNENLEMNKTYTSAVVEYNCPLLSIISVNFSSKVFSLIQILKERYVCKQWRP